MSIECWSLVLEVFELALKVIFWCEVLIFIRKIYRVMADTEKVLEEAMAELGLADEEPSQRADNQEHKDTLIGLAQSGLLHKIGIKKTESQLASMSEADIEKTYIEYQRRYTSCVSDDMVNNILYGYASVCQWLAPGTEKEKLRKELTENFVIGAEIKKQLGQLGIALSPWLAVANAAVITAKHVDLKQTGDDITSQVPGPSSQPDTGLSPESKSMQ